MSDGLATTWRKSQSPIYRGRSSDSLLFEVAAARTRRVVLQSDPTYLFTGSFERFDQIDVKSTVAYKTFIASTCKYIKTAHETLHAITQNVSTAVIASDELLFRALMLLWREERGTTSSITKMAMCPSYQRIIAMGPKAIPIILRQMESEGDEPDMWFWALRVLTNADPVPEDARGNIVRMAEAWLNWARDRYVW